MVDSHTAIAKIKALLFKWSKDQNMEAAYYAATKLLLSEIPRHFNELENSTFADEKYTLANSHIDDMFCTKTKDSGNNFTDSYGHAHSAIYLLGEEFSQFSR